MVGTQSGKIILFDSKSFKMLDAYIAHNKKITDLWIQHKRAIVSCSHDSKIYVRTLSLNEFDNQMIEIEELKGEEFQCIEIIDNLCVPASLECFIGT